MFSYLDCGVYCTVHHTFLGLSAILEEREEAATLAAGIENLSVS
jgi:hypothetical protein